jgi:ferric-dicitrate binding protein FerR (iron transport regulator)
MEHREQDEIVRLIDNYLAGSAGEEEIRYLQKWVETSDQNKLYYQQIKNIRDLSEYSNESVPISTDKALQNVLGKISKEKQHRNIWSYWQKIAAVLLIPIIIGSLILVTKLSQKISGSVTLNEVFANYGTRTVLTLSDGSKVWLNSGSSLRYPDKFLTNNRMVFLTGEAYFEVHSDKSKPFLVQTSSVCVKATGTKFNVSAYKTNQLVSVALIEGKVSVNKAKQGNVGTFLSEMKPNEYLEFDTLSGNVSNKLTNDVYQYVAWKDGKLIFRNEPLKEVVKKLSQLYNVDIELKGKELQEYSYRATFKEESLNEILRLLKLSSPINYKEIERKPLSDGSYPVKKIVIYPANEK